MDIQEQCSFNGAVAVAVEPFCVHLFQGNFAFLNMQLTLSLSFLKLNLKVTDCTVLVSLFLHILGEQCFALSNDICGCVCVLFNSVTNMCVRI